MSPVFLAFDANPDSPKDEMETLTRAIRAFARKVLGAPIQWYQEFTEIGNFEGIRITDGTNDSLLFGRTIKDALQLVKDADPRRFLGVKRHINMISNMRLWYRGAQYQEARRICIIDFRPLREHEDHEWVVGSCACTLIHEATHGRIAARGIKYTPKLRARIEELCVREESRFLLRLASTKPDLAESLRRAFDSSEWNHVWSATPKEQWKELWRRD
jgi:hypothetical protein